MNAVAILLTLMAPLEVTDSDSNAAYVVYTSDGRVASLDAVVAAMAQSDVVFLGESHDDAISHFLERRLLELAHQELGGEDGNRSVVLALEMFERDAQAVIDEYLHGMIRERDFLAAARPWSNYDSDYRPMVEYARENGIPVLATNAPARYVSLVGREGSDALRKLSRDARRWIAPLPLEDASQPYARRFEETMAAMMRPHRAPADSTPVTHPAPDSADTGSVHRVHVVDSARAEGDETPERPMSPPDAATDQPARPSHTNSFMLDAQNLRDATMGHTLARAHKEIRRALIIHVNGSFHSNYRLGVPEHLRRHRKKARQLVVSLSAEGYPHFDDESMGELGDFVILTNPNHGQPSP